MNGGSGRKLRRVECDIAAERTDAADRWHRFTIDSDFERASIAGPQRETGARRHRINFAGF